MSGKIDAATVGLDVTEGIDLAGLDRSDRLLYVELLAWSAGHDADGFVPAAMLRRMTDHDDPTAAVDRLVDIGRLVEVEDGWQVENARRYMLPKAEKTTLRDKGAERQAAWRARRNGTSNGVTSTATEGVSSRERVVAKRSGAKTTTPRSARSADAARAARDQDEPVCVYCGNPAPPGLELASSEETDERWCPMPGMDLDQDELVAAWLAAGIEENELGEMCRTPPPGLATCAKCLHANAAEGMRAVTESRLASFDDDGQVFTEEVEVERLCRKPCRRCGRRCADEAES